MAFDLDLEQKLQSGGRLTSAGVFVLVASFLGTCVVGMGSRDPMASGMEVGESPLLAIGLALGVALIAIGQARKANARNEASRRLRDENTTLKTVLDPDVDEGPFRGATKHVPVVSPEFQAYEQAATELDRARGTRFLWLGFALIAASVLLVFMGMRSGDSTRERLDALFTSLGLGVFPFGFGLFFAIKGALLRNR